MYLAEIEKIMFQYKTGVLPDILHNIFYEGIRFKVMIPGMPVPQFHVPKCRTNIRRFSFQYQSPLIFFNSLSPDIQSSVSVSALKKKLKKYLLT